MRHDVPPTSPFFNSYDLLNSVFKIVVEIPIS
jgi:hypothetical protein